MDTRPLRWVPFRGTGRQLDYLQSLVGSTQPLRWDRWCSLSPVPGSSSAWKKPGTRRPHGGSCECNPTQLAQLQYVDVAREWRGIVDSIFKSPALFFFIEKTLFMEHQTRELDHRNYRSCFTRWAWVLFKRVLINVRDWGQITQQHRHPLFPSARGGIASWCVAADAACSLGSPIPTPCSQVSAIQLVPSIALLWGHVMLCQVTDTRLPRVLRRTRGFHN
ncbi:hypothetical protein BGY98DRAFT_472789 [Russula aff. rugulosa BPL654]|nr:hypothetical protein BGY98DRAFT_472789 [Russula aff. rugulosa BPL654]